MSSFRFLHCSDLHIDSPFTGLSSVQPSLAEQLRNSTHRAFLNIVEIALKEEVEAVVIAGDVYDGADKSLQAQLKFRRGLQRLADAEIDTFIVHGNHDPLDGWSASLEWPERVHVFSGTVERHPVIRNGEVRAQVYGISYPRREVKENLARQFVRDDGPGFAIGLLHANVGHQAGHDDYAPCSLEDLVAANMDYWALGHIHRYQILRESDPAVVYPGNSQARHMRETGEKGCCLVTLHKNAAPEIRFVPIDVVRYVCDEVDLSGRITLEEVIHAVQAKCERLADQVNGRDVLIRLSLKGRTEVHAELWKGETLEDLQEEVRLYFRGKDPAVWMDLVLDTDGVYDVESLKQGNDFIADILGLYEEVEKSGEKVELKEALKPMFETWQGRKYLEDFSDEEMRGILVRARSLTLDQLLERTP
ncbi:MAG: DNA repair exonuclease [Nitrospinae bacterium]|nr:DNA repair exonuclease [Nitrospinota bacterium]